MNMTGPADSHCARCNIGLFTPITKATKPWEGATCGNCGATLCADCWPGHRKICWNVLEGQYRG